MNSYPNSIKSWALNPLDEHKEQELMLIIYYEAATFKSIAFWSER